MTNLSHLVQDLRAEAHTVPPRPASLMRQAAAALDRAGRRATVRSDLDFFLDADPPPPPIPPPPLSGKHQRPAKAPVE